LKNLKLQNSSAMFKFIKQYAEKIDGISVYPLAGQLIFFTFFILVLVYVYRMKKSNVDEMKNLPLDQ
jgi:cytochrome c oxidase cbb3-type subunit 4